MVNKPRPRRNYSVGLARRKYILEIATEEFAKHGYQGASLAQIAARVGLTQAGLLHHFRSKSELLIEVLALRDAVDADDLGLMDAQVPEGRGTQALDRLVTLVRRNAERRGLVQLFAVIVGESVTEDHPGWGWVRQRYAVVRTSVVEGLQRGVEDGTIRHDVDVEAVAAAVVATMDGLQIQWLLDHDFDMVGAFVTHVDLVKRSIAASPGEGSDR